jgi:hypothetical protein
MRFRGKDTQTNFLKRLYDCGSFNSSKGKEMESKSNILIGWASRDVTPAGKVNLAGQFNMRLTKEIKDPLFVTALAVSSQDNKDSFIFVSCDTVTIPAALLEKCRAKIKAEAKDFPIGKLVLNATHTHTAPDTRDGGYNYSALTKEESEDLLSPKENMEFLAGKITEAAIESWNKREPGLLAWGLNYAVVGRNRRAVYLKDFAEQPDYKETPGMKIEKNAMMYGNTANPFFSHIEGYEDHTVQFLFTFNPDKKLTGSIINIVSPSQATEGISQVSADFWHDVRIQLRKQYGEDLFILPQCSAAGDQSPHLMLNKKAEQRMLELKGIDSRQEIAGRIKSAFDDAYGWAPKDLRDNLQLKHICKKINLSKRTVTEEEYNKNIEWIKQFQAMQLTSSQERYLSRCQNVVERYENQLKGIFPVQPVEIHVIKLGDIVFATNPFELFLDYGIQIQAGSPAQQTFVVQLAGEGVGNGGTYLPTEKAEIGGGYSASVYCNVVGSKGGEELVEETLKAINKLWQE